MPEDVGMAHTGAVAAFSMVAAVVLAATANERHDDRVGWQGKPGNDRLFRRDAAVCTSPRSVRFVHANAPPDVAPSVPRAVLFAPKFRGRQWKVGVKVRECFRSVLPHFEREQVVEGLRLAQDTAEDDDTLPMLSPNDARVQLGAVAFDLQQRGPVLGASRGGPHGHSGLRAVFRHFHVRAKRVRQGREVDRGWDVGHRGLLAAFRNLIIVDVGALPHPAFFRHAKHECIVEADFARVATATKDGKLVVAATAPLAEDGSGGVLSGQRL
jgi:hypothetical protein